MRNLKLALAAACAGIVFGFGGAFAAEVTDGSLVGAYDVTVPSDAKKNAITDSAHQGSWTAAMAFNNEYASYAGRYVVPVAKIPFWVRYQFKNDLQPKLCGYSITPSTDSNETPSRTPKSWTFEGSNDGVAWTVLGAESDVTGWKNGVSRYFTADDTAGYTYFQLHVTTHNGDSSFASLGEVEFYSRDVSVNVVGEPANYGTAEGITYGVEELIDRGTEKTFSVAANLTVDDEDSSIHYVPVSDGVAKPGYRLVVDDDGDGVWMILAPQQPIPYRAWNETTRQMEDCTCTDYTVVTAGTATFADGKWYAVTGTVERGSIAVNGTAHLILCDGAKLTATSVTNEAGIAVAAGNSLTIYGQEHGTGELVAKNKWVGAGYAGACIGGVLGKGCGTVTINGGTITAISEGAGAGIGGAWGGSCGSIIINGGKITAKGNNAAGIGDGGYGRDGKVTINGGTVDASQGYSEADIGFGKYGSGTTVTISGGNVKAATILNAPTNSANEAVWCVTVNCEGVGDQGSVIRVEGLEGYGTNDVFAIDGKVYLYLPNGIHTFTIDGEKYFAEVNDSATTAMKFGPFGPDLPPEKDPRVISTTDPLVIAAQLDAVNSEANELARDGVVTVSFDPSVTGKTVFVDRLLGELTGFTNVSLVIEGPITLDAGGRTRFFTIGEGNTVEFRDVTFANGRDTSAGGAVLGERCDVTFTRCTFKDCTAPYGGAVCLDYADSRGLFTDCVFAGNSAGIRGAAVYNDMCSLRFIRTEIRPEDVEERLRVLVEHSPRQIAENPDCETPDAFANTAEAVRTLESGCTLVLLNADAEKDLEVLEIPAGVTVVRRYARVVDGEVVVEGGASSLQDGIDMAKSEGVDTIRVAPGRYAPVTVPSGLDGLVLVGADPSSCVIDGTLADPAAACLVSESANVTVSNLLFRAGRSSASGGGVSGVKTVIHCGFDGCSAAVDGGGVAGDGSTVVKLSLFRNCTAPTGAAVSGVKAYACTFVNETVSDGVTTVDAGSALYGCFAAGCKIASGEESYSTDDPEGDFVRPGEDYAIKVASLGKYPADGLLGQAKSEGWADVFGRSSVVSIAGRERLFAGAFAPEVPDQSLQAMIDAAPKDGVVEIPAGTYGPATVPSEKGALTLRPEAGAKVTVDGMGLGSALTLQGAATVEGLTITGGAAEKGGGVSGVAAATVRACVIVGNRATVSGGGASGVTAQNCTFVGNAAPNGAAAANSTVRVSLGATADQTLSACGTIVDWFVAAEGDFADFAHGDYSIPEANWARFTASDDEYGRDAYEERLADINGHPLVRRVAGDYVCLAGAYALDYNDSLQRLIDFTAGDLIEVPDGVYEPFVIERDDVELVHTGSPSGCTVDGSRCRRGADVTGENVTIKGMTFRNCAAESGGGVYGEAAKLRVENCAFEGCTADLHGGAVYAVEDGTVVTGCAFTGNSATNPNSAGGALYVANALVAGCFFRGNSAVCAGALAAESGTRTICCTFAGNTATGAAFAATASAAYAADAGQTLADCVLFDDTQTGFVTEGRVLTPVADPFVASGSGDWRLRSDLLAAAVDAGADVASMVAAVRDAGAVMPGGSPLVASLAGEDVLFAGAYGLAASNMLQELIDRASPGDEITVAAGEYLPAVIPADKAGLTLTGSGAAVVDGRGRFRCLTVLVGGVTLKGLTFANGWTDGDGGGVGGGESVAAVIDCTFSNCTAANGGAFINDGTLVASNCVFSGNAARGGSGITPAPTGLGGAVLNRGAAVFERCTFKGNSAVEGGAICNTAMGRLTGVCSTFTGNRAIAGGSTGGNGGAIAQTTVSDAGSPDTLLVNCTLTGNTADGCGGAVYAQGTSGVLSLVLVDVIAVGNAGTYDLYLQSGACAEADYTAYGSRNDSSASGWGGTVAEGGKGVVDLFADVSADGSVAYPTNSADGQVVFPLMTGLVFPTAWVRHNDDWSYAGCAVDKSASTWTALRDATKIPPRQQSSHPILETDQLGNSFTRPPLGATSTTKPQQVWPVLPLVEENACFRIRVPSGATAMFELADDAAKALMPGGSVEIVTIAVDEAANGGVAAAFQRLQAQFVDAARQVVIGKPWYTATTEGAWVKLTLNEQARPRLDENSALDMTSSRTEVSAIPSNVKSELWYGLGCSASPTGPFVVEEDGWVQADVNGVLHEALKGTKEGAGRFYRVIVRDAFPEGDFYR